MYKRVLIGLDGSDCSQYGGKIAVTIAEKLNAELIAAHVYSSELHAQRFRDMEEGLPEQYQDGQIKKKLRRSHDSLIAEGFDALSQGYLEGLVAQARKAGVTVRAVTTAGSNYVKLIELAEQTAVDLIVLGAHGVGSLGDGLLGSTAARVLRHSTCDVLIVRHELNGQAVIAGIDGSQLALSAAAKAASLAQTLAAPLHLAAAYDPNFHTEVFQTMGRALPPERQEQIGLDKQEGLHEELINDGLAKLYRGFLDDALRHLGANGDVESVLLAGKAYRAIVDHASERQAGLVVVGRFGHHHQGKALIGSNAETVAATCLRNVLVTGAVKADSPTHCPQAAESTIDSCNDKPPATSRPEWTSEALGRLERIPPMARAMAKRMIEDAARDAGSDVIDLNVFTQVAQKFGMGPSGKTDE